jgi:uncharacterized membrane protein YsdA (DUF1294 family)
MVEPIFGQYTWLFWTLLALNIFTFFIYGSDKLFAQAGAWRVRERTLLVLALIGGSPGALAAMRIFRHKTKKPLFGLLFVVILLVQLALLYWFSPLLSVGPGPITIGN